MFENDTMNTEAVQQTSSEAATIEGSSFLSAFAGDGMPTYADDNETEAEAAETEELTGSEDKQTEAKKAPDDGGRDYKIKYKGQEETLHLTDDQLIAMLQKGRDYDEVRKQRDELTTQSKDYDDLSRLADYIAANNGMPRSEYMKLFNEQTSEDGIRKQIDEDYPDASEELKAELFESRKAKADAAKEKEHDEAINADIAALRSEYPDADIDNLPADVKSDIENGMKPLDAYRLHELKELRKAKADADATISALKKENDNRKRTLGRVETVDAPKGQSEFEKAFMSSD